MDHNYSLAITEIPPKRKLRPSASRKLWDKRRSKTRVNIGVAFCRWRELRDKLRIDKDATLACFL